MYESIKNHCQKLTTNFDEINEDRKHILNKITSYIKQKSGNQTQLIYVCTHNSRRSHFGQIWAVIASDFYNIQNVKAYSAGTEQTVFHPNAIEALKRIGFKIEKGKEEQNPKYVVNYGKNQSMLCFSKTIDHKTLPQQNFAAIMTCDEAEQNCPFLPGAEFRIATTYQDPKVFDDTPGESGKYDERCNQIALETLYVFSQL